MEQIEKIYRENWNKMVKRLVRKGVQLADAEDSVQNIFLRLIEGNLSDQDKDVTPLLWHMLPQSVFQTLSRNSSGTSGSIDSDIMSDHSDNAEQTVINRDTIKHLCNYIDELKGKNTRDILKLHFLHQFTPKEIIKLNRYNPQTVYNTISQFKKAMR